MTRRFSIVAVVLLISASVAAQNAPRKAAQPAAKSVVPTDADRELSVRKRLALDLLQNSHALNDQVDPNKKFELLNTEIGVANRLDPKLATQWARELFDLGASGQDRNSGLAQILAIGAIASSDPEEAVAMLGRVTPIAVAPQAVEVLGETYATRFPEMAFEALLKKSGKAALPKILEVADSMGEKGRYPYRGVMAAAIETKDDATIEHTARQLLTRCQRRVDDPAAGFDFAATLKEVESHWPKELLKPALAAAVDDIEQMPSTDQSKNFEAVFKTDAATATARGPVEVGLLRIASMIQRDNPELWADLLAKYPNLGTGPAADFRAHGGSAKFCISKCEGPVTNPEVQKQEVLAGILRLIWTKPDQVAGAINSISDPTLRAEALLRAAEQTAQKHPEQSAAYSAQAAKLAAQIKDPEIRFRSACARLRSDAVNGNRAALPDDLDTAFQLGDEFMRKAREEHRDTAGAASVLINAANDAMKIEPELTVAHIQSVYLPYERAMMLASAASALIPAEQPKPKPAPKAEANAKTE